jgi:hypothetical protein
MTVLIVRSSCDLPKGERNKRSSGLSSSSSSSSSAVDYGRRGRGGRRHEENDAVGYIASNPLQCDVVLLPRKPVASRRCRFERRGRYHHVSIVRTVRVRDSPPSGLDDHRRPTVRNTTVCRPSFQRKVAAPPSGKRLFTTIIIKLRLIDAYLLSISAFDSMKKNARVSPLPNNTRIWLGGGGGTRQTLGHPLLWEGGGMRASGLHPHSAQGTAWQLPTIGDINGWSLLWK